MECLLPSARRVQLQVILQSESSGKGSFRSSPRWRVKPSTPANAARGTVPEMYGSGLGSVRSLGYLRGWLQLARLSLDVDRMERRECWYQHSTLKTPGNLLALTSWLAPSTTAGLRDLSIDCRRRWRIFCFPLFLGIISSAHLSRKRWQCGSLYSKRIPTSYPNWSLLLLTCGMRVCFHSQIQPLSLMSFFRLLAYSRTWSTAALYGNEALLLSWSPCYLNSSHAWLTTWTFQRRVP